MDIPPADIRWFDEAFKETARKMIESWEDSGSPTIQDEPSPDILFNAMQELLVLLHTLDYESRNATGRQNPDEPDLTELGDYGIHILEEFALQSNHLGLENKENVWEHLAVSLARWIALQGGELQTLSIVVNGLAYIANHSENQAQLEQLYLVMGEVCDASTPPEHLSEPNGEVENPWRMLLINRAIVATRTLSPRLMEEAFSDITVHLPETAPDFFREGMEQVEIQNYPEQVRDVIQRYLSEWPVKRVLH